MGGHLPLHRSHCSNQKNVTAEALLKQRWRRRDPKRPANSCAKETAEKGAASIVVVAPDTTSDESIVVGDVPLRWSGFA